MSANIFRGRRAKKNGDEFERLIKQSAYKLGWEAIKIPTGSKTFGKNKIIREKSPFDFVLAKNKRSVFFDAKSTVNNTFSYSHINQTQVTRLLSLEHQGFYSGYVVKYGDNEVYFYSANILRDLKPRESLYKLSGICLGKSDCINFDLFENDNIIISCLIKRNAV